MDYKTLIVEKEDNIAIVNCQTFRSPWGPQTSDDRQQDQVGKETPIWGYASQRCGGESRGFLSLRFIAGYRQARPLLTLSVYFRTNRRNTQLLVK